MNWKLVVAVGLGLWIAGVTYKTIRGAQWDRQQHQGDEMRRRLMDNEVRVLREQGWHRDSLTGMWTPP